MKVLNEREITTIWARQRQQTGLDIPALSQRNLKRWRQRALVHFSESELQKLQEEWQRAVVPEFKLNHVTRDLKTIKQSGSLQSINLRQANGLTVNNKHTYGRIDVRRDYVYFSLALKQMSPTYWRDKPELIQVDCQQASRAVEQPLAGLWIGSHGGDMSQSRQVFDGVARCVHYEGQQRMTVFHYPDGSSKQISIHRDEEIFCGQQRLQDIFDGLFYQIVDDIGHIGGRFKARLLQFDPSAEILRGFFHYGYQPTAYPEAKLCQQLNVQADYVETFEHYGPCVENCVALFKAIRQGDVDKVNTLLSREPNLLQATTQKDTVLTAMLGGHYRGNDAVLRRRAMLALLSRYGFDPSFHGATDTDGFEQCLKLSGAEAKLALDMIQGIAVPNHPYIRLAYRFKRSNYYFQKAITSRRSDVVLALTQAHVQPEANNRLIYTLYNQQFQLQLDDKTLTVDETVDWFVQQFQLDPLCDGEFAPLLHVAVSGNKPKFIRWFLTKFPNYDVNVKNKIGDSALHTAIRHRADVAICELLRDIGVDVSIVNTKGETAFSLANDLAHADVATLNGYRMRPADRVAEIEQDDASYLQQLRSSYVTAKKLFADNAQATRAIYPKTAAQSAKQRKISASVMLICTNDKDQVSVLMVRKRDNLQGCQGNYLFPGGFVDAAESDPCAAADRECLEETGITCRSRLWQSVDTFVDGIYYQHHFSFCELTDKSIPIAVAADDVGEAIWIPWYQIKPSNDNDVSTCVYQNVLIEPSNMLMMQTLIDNLDNFSACATAWKAKISAEKQLQQHFKNNNLAEFIQVVKQNAVTFTDATWLCAAVQARRETWIQPLLDCGVAVNAGTDRLSVGGLLSICLSSINALILAIQTRQFSVARRLIASGADVNRAYHELSPLSACCGLAFDDEVKQFMQMLLSQPGIELAQDVGLFAMMAAVANNNVAAFDLIWQADKQKLIDINRPVTHIGNMTNLLTQAVLGARVEITQRLLALGAKPVPDQDSKVFICLFIEAYYCYTQNIVCQLRGSDAPESFLDKTSRRFGVCQQSKHSVDRYHQYMAIWEMLQAYLPESIDKNFDVKRAEDRSFIIFRYQQNGRTRYCLKQQTRIHADEQSVFSSPFQLPCADDFYGQNVIPAEGAETLLSIDMITDAKEYQKINMVVVDVDSEQLSNRYSRAEFCWVDWHDVQKMQLGESQPYFNYQQSSICQIDAVLIDALERGQVIDKQDPQLKTLFFEKMLRHAMLGEAYNRNDADAIAHHIQAGADLNHGFSNLVGFCDIPMPTFDEKYNAGRHQLLFNRYRLAEATIVSSSDRVHHEY